MGKATILLRIKQAISLARTGWVYINAKAQGNQSLSLAESNRQLTKIDEFLREIMGNSGLPKIQICTLLAEFMEQRLIKHVSSSLAVPSMEKMLLGLEGRLHHLGETFSSHYETVYAGPGIPAGFKTIPPELPYPSISTHDVIQVYGIDPYIEMFKYLLPTSWKLANSDEERQFHWKQGVTADEKRDLLSNEEKFSVHWYAYPTSYSGPVLTNVEQLKTFLSMLVNSIGSDSDLNIRMYGDLRLLIEWNSHYLHTRKRLLDACLDLKAFKNLGKTELARAKKSEMEKLSGQGSDATNQLFKIEQRLFDLSDGSDFVDSLVKQGTLRPDDLSERILTSMEADAKTSSFDSVYKQLRQDILSEANREEVIALHCLIYKAIQWKHMQNHAIPKQADANIDRLSQDLGITADQGEELASRIGLLYDLSSEGWHEAYLDINDAISDVMDKDKWNDRKLNATNYNKALGFQTLFSFVKTSLLGQAARYQISYTQQEWQEWATENITSLQSQLEFLLRQNSNANEVDQQTATTLIEQLGSV